MAVRDENLWPYGIRTGVLHIDRAAWKRTVFQGDFSWFTVHLFPSFTEMVDTLCWTVLNR